MAAPPTKKGRTDNSVEEKESTTITMVLQTWAKGQKEQFSPVHRINGFPFRVRMYRSGRSMYTSVVCDMSREAELWECTTTITKFCTQNQDSYTVNYRFYSWNVAKCETGGWSINPEAGSSVQFTIVVNKGKDSWYSKLRPNLVSIKSPNGILVIGEKNKKKKEIRVNKEFLASQSPYFDRLFFGDFKEKNMKKIPIGDVEYEEFNNIIEMVYESSGALLTDENLYNVLDLADRFELKIVEDKVVSYLIIPESCHPEDSEFSLAQKLLISQERNIPILKKLILTLDGYYDLSDMGKVKYAPEYADLSDATKVEILERMMDLALNCRCDCLCIIPVIECTRFPICCSAF